VVLEYRENGRQFGAAGPITLEQVPARISIVSSRWVRVAVWVRVGGAEVVKASAPPRAEPPAARRAPRLAMRSLLRRPIVARCTESV